MSPAGGGVFVPVVGGAFLSPAGGGVFVPVVGGAFLSPAGGAFLSPAGDVGDFLGVVVDVSDAAFTAFGAIPARPSDNANMAVIFFISILECGVFNNETISNSQKNKETDWRSVETIHAPDTLGESCTASLNQTALLP